MLVVSLLVGNFRTVTLGKERTLLSGLDRNAGSRRMPRWRAWLRMARLSRKSAPEWSMLLAKAFHYGARLGFESPGLDQPHGGEGGQGAAAETYAEDRACQDITEEVHA